MSEDPKKFQIWAEGFAATGQSGKAFLFGESEGADFQEACDRFFARREYKGFYNPGRLTHWGCKLFDNEQDARKSFG